MFDQKRNSLVAARILAALLIAALTGSALHAGSERRFEGTVKSIGSDSLTIETAGHKVQTIKITSATKFLHHNKPSSLSEMKPGNHAVIHATASPSAADTTSTTTPSANTSAADTSSSTSAKTTDTHKDTLSLGLSFSATQVSY